MAMSLRLFSEKKAFRCSSGVVESKVFAMWKIKAEGTCRLIPLTAAQADTMRDIRQLKQDRKRGRLRQTLQMGYRRNYDSKAQLLLQVPS